MAKSIRVKLKSEADWEKWSDALALARAQEILDDPKRSKAAKKMAAEMVKEKAAELASMAKVAQEAFEAVEAMIVESIKDVYENSGKDLPENFEEVFKKTAKETMKKKGWSKSKVIGFGLAISKKKKEKK